MTSIHVGSAIIVFGAALALAACSQEPRKGPPTKQKIHANYSGGASGTPSCQSYRCDDNRPLLVDFKDQGLTLELRRDGSPTPVLLTAPTQRLRYVGEAMSAIFAGNEIKVEEAGKSPVMCWKAMSL